MSNKEFLIGVGKDSVTKTILPTIPEDNDILVTIPLSPIKKPNNNISEFHGIDLEVLCFKIKCGTYEEACMGIFNLLCINFKCKCNKCCKN